MTKKSKKFNCYKCKFKGDVPGSCHISCHHPSIKKMEANPMAKLMAIMGGVGRASPILASSKKLNIKGNLHGITSGWFNWPWNFDPTWLENCDGYKEVEDVTTKRAKND